MRANLIFFLIIMLLVIIINMIYKNYKLILKYLFNGLIFCLKLILLTIPIFVFTKSKQLFLNIQLKCKYYVLRIKSLFEKRVLITDEDSNNICPICMEPLVIKPVMKFICNRHEVHVDCYKIFEQLKKDKLEVVDCPFRDA